MSEMFDLEAVRQKLAALPTETYQASETVLAEGSTTGDVLVLKAGAVEVVKDGVRLGKITEPGGVFGGLFRPEGAMAGVSRRTLPPKWSPAPNETYWRNSIESRIERDSALGPHRAQRERARWRRWRCCSGRCGRIPSRGGPARLHQEPQAGGPFPANPDVKERVLRPVPDDGTGDTLANLGKLPFAPLDRTVKVRLPSTVGFTRALDYLGQSASQEHWEAVV